MTYNDLLAIGSVIEPSSDALWLPKRERGAKSVWLFVCLFVWLLVWLFIFGLVWFYILNERSCDTERRLFFRSSKHFPPLSIPTPSLILLFSLLPPPKKRVDKAGVEGFSFSSSYSFFPLCN